MSDTIRHSIMDNLKAQFVAQNAASGLSVVYAVVDEWRLHPLEATDLPAIVLLDTVANVTRTDDVITDYDMEMAVAFYAKGNETAGQLRNMILDAYRVVGIDRTLGGYAEDVLPLSETISMQSKDNVYGDVEVKFNVRFATGAYDPTKNYS
jgi:hypothetical protein